MILGGGARRSWRSPPLQPIEVIELPSGRTAEPQTTPKVFLVPKPPLDDGEGKILTVKHTCLRAPTSLVPKLRDHCTSTMGNPTPCRNSHSVETGHLNKDHTSCHAPLATTTKVDADGGLMAPTIPHNHTQGSVDPTAAPQSREPIKTSCALPTKN